jgi:flagellar protein FlgJ
VARDEESQGLEAIRKRDDRELKEPRNAQLDQAAKMYEKQFLREMVKAMRGTVSFGIEKPSMAENVYRDELDNQYVESWGDKGGIGLADLIYDQVMERYFNGSAGGRALKEQGAIPLTDRDLAKVHRVKTTETPGQVPLRVELKPSADGSPAKLQAPWDAEVVSNSRLEGGKTALTLKHGDSLKSTLIFQGVASADAQPGAKIARGTQVAVLSPEIRTFFWNLNRSLANPDGSPAR